MSATSNNWSLFVAVLIVAVTTLASAAVVQTALPSALAVLSAVLLVAGLLVGASLALRSRFSAGWPLLIAAVLLGASILLPALAWRTQVYLAGAVVGLVVLISSARSGASTRTILLLAVALAVINVVASALAA
jgi:hypothetical protein